MICRLLNEDPVLCQIRKDNNVTYESSSHRSESSIMEDQSPIVKGSYNNSAAKNGNYSHHKNNQEEEYFQGENSTKKKKQEVQHRKNNRLDDSLELKEFEIAKQDNSHHTSKQMSMLVKDDKQQRDIIELADLEESNFLQRHHSGDLNGKEEIKLSFFEQEFERLYESTVFFYGEYRIDEAGVELQKLRQLIAEHTNDDVILKYIFNYNKNQEEMKRLQEERINTQTVILNLERDMKELDAIMTALDDLNNLETVLQDKKKGILMQVRRQEGQRGVTFRYEAKNLKVHLFNLLALLNETDLYDLWFPQCKKSYTLRRLAKATKMAYVEFFFPFPFTNRESVMYGLGANRMKTHGSIVIMAKSYGLINDQQLRDQVGELEFKERKAGLVEMEVHQYGFEITPTAPGEISIRAIMLFNPNMDKMPESLVNWGTKNFLEYMINKMIKFSKGFQGTSYEKRLKNSENTEFYIWIQTYIRDFYQERCWEYNHYTF
ncbi:protein kinase domain protein [Stylonychia lemnae]|uniref:Protein kinase domain protein n=1 Tax=Stylonychia lemnae TaxID=5949 RepID=A0A078A3C3_STYLE|nr:protein kinase domain protein [Stylonychia lemnae]|eukprot:CDW76008.1 protein kinase domain protein [Stylonychia lemnae]